MIFIKKKYTSLDVVKIPLKHFTKLTMMYYVILILLAILPTGILSMLIANFIDTTVAVFNAQKTSSDVYYSAIFLIVIMILTAILSPILSLIESKISISLDKNILPELVKKQAELPYYYIENANNWEVIDRITEEMNQTFIEGMQGYGTILQQICSILSVIIYLYTHIWWSAIVLLVASIPFYILASFFGKKIYESKIDTYKYERRYSYYSDEILTNQEAKDEKTVFNFTDKIANRYYHYFEKARDIQLKVFLKSLVSMKATDIFLSVISIVILIILTPQINKGITIGVFIGVTTSLFSISDNLGWTVANAIQKIAEAKEYMKELTDLFLIDSVKEATCMPSDKQLDFESLEFVNVWFKYPNSKEYSLKGISFKIINGNQYGFVGVNGSGKTTITKLITRLYGTYEGTILLNGKDLQLYSLSEIKAIFSVVHQDYSKYEVSIKENITFGNISQEIDENNLNNVIDELSLNNIIHKLSNGIDTRIGKLGEDNFELSGGQWQLIAIARSLYSVAPIKILDEPVASLDPILESKIYENFATLMNNKTSILITHRLGSIKLVDKIFVIDNGKIIEEGSHDELMKLNKTYANMYTVQSRWYNE
ncbi:ABC transporter ATP-binding protein [Aerococcaceae bacterium zg-ZJ1578]|uniref:ABC transporter ATP-binding protein n=1 Tax=Aerococcaceae bacterium zg-252 TaxID=2796928 RepID=UPI001A2FB96B|nr:ABC transporter ATP-binding protein [Aerococcaceae bacterium zg-1578]